ncbi:hypothetical protein B0T25DRAFT_573472 [Lasiosphaeria hispida]|uniref:Uncharacterized protein n=1 Tax=Lasiosphaeria hispida TaxID=260671 RepID=A0AAJ0MAE3_9PEZI|nr:hypothetical protein B0T25DRAFT_573472 [Lasiosphaeria hispida]
MAILATGISALPTTLSERTLDKRCTPGTTTILAPHDMILYELHNPSNTPGYSTGSSLFLQLNSPTYSYRQLLRFNTPSTGKCAWVMNFPASRYNTEVHQQQPDNGGPVHLSFYGVERSYKAGGTLGDVKLIPGPWSSKAVQPGEQTLVEQPCEQMGTDMFVRTPEGHEAVSQMVYWNQDIKEWDAQGSLGIYMRVTC